VAFHSVTQFQDSGAMAHYARLGSAGVDLFFVISGFIMWVTAISRDQDPRRFVLNRVIRIVPLYWLVTTFVLAVVLLAPALMHSASFELAHSVASYSFIAWPHPKFDGQFWPLVVPGWTLNYEMLFYAVVTAALFARRSLRLWVIGGCLGLLMVIGLVRRPVSIMSFYTDPILVEFLFGIGIGALYLRMRRLPRSAAWALIAISAAWLLTIGTHSSQLNRPLTWGLPMALLVLGAVNLPTLAPGNALAMLGDASYSIYLAQFITIAPGARLLTRLAGTAPGRLLAALVLMVIAVAAGMFLYRVVEKPVTDALRRSLKRGPGYAPRTNPA
jgi:exopolysaccharide production protein ExoZ